MNRINSEHGLKGSIELPGDKSITHRAILFSALAAGESSIRTSLLGRDNLASLRVVKALGSEVQLRVPRSFKEIVEEEGFSTEVVVSDRELDGCEIRIASRGLDNFLTPVEPIYCGNSGTTARLVCGILSAVPFATALTGDHSLSQRPFDRVVTPLTKMGATFSNNFLPLTISGAGRQLQGGCFTSTRASAQVKSAILLAGLYADGETTVIEPSLSRDHTERMLCSAGARLVSELSADGSILIKVVPLKERVLSPLAVNIVGDLSSAAFFIVAALIIPDSQILIRNVGINPTRTGILDILKRMGGQIEIVDQREEAGELVADLRCCSSRLSGVEVNALEVVRAIDEIPVLSLALAVADGESRITGAAELRVKESDRLATVSALLRSFSVDVTEEPEGLIIKGGLAPRSIKNINRSPVWFASGDHRIAMCAAILELYGTGRCELGDIAAVETSFPSFMRLLKEAVTAR